MKTLKLFSSIFTMFLALVLLVGCNISQSYADKINKAAENNEHFTSKEVIEKLGEENCIKGLIAGNGAVIAIKGIDDLDQLKEDLENGKTVKGIVVVFVFDKATSAHYGEITEEDLSLLKWL